jgi:hypothetical protein
VDKAAPSSDPETDEKRRRKTTLSHVVAAVVAGKFEVMRNKDLDLERAQELVIMVCLSPWPADVRALTTLHSASLRSSQWEVLTFAIADG